MGCARSVVFVDFPPRYGPDFPASDRSYDTRGYGGRDGYDSYMAAPPSRYDSRAPAPCVLLLQWPYCSMLTASPADAPL